MKIYLGNRLLWRVFTYDLYMKIVLGFLSKVFTYDQGTKPEALRWSQKAPFFLTRKNVIFWTRKNPFFRTIRRRKMIKIVFQKIPPPEQKALARPKKRNFFPQGRFPKYRYFFGVGRPKNGENSTPSAMGQMP